MTILRLGEQAIKGDQGTQFYASMTLQNGRPKLLTARIKAKVLISGLVSLLRPHRDQHKRRGPTMHPTDVQPTERSFEQRTFSVHQLRCNKSCLQQEVEHALARYCALMTQYTDVLQRTKSESEKDEKRKCQEDDSSSHAFRSLWACVLELVELGWAIRAAEEHEALLRNLRPEKHPSKQDGDETFDFGLAAKSLDCAIKAAVSVVKTSMATPTA